MKIRSFSPHLARRSGLGPANLSVTREDASLIKARFWERPGVRTSEKASLPRRDGPYGGLSPASVISKGRMFIAASPLYGDASRNAFFKGTEVAALDTRKLKALAGGKLPHGAELARIVNANPDVVLAKARFDQAGQAEFDVPAGTEVTVWTGAQGAHGAPPTQAMAMVGNVQDFEGPAPSAPIRQGSASAPHVERERGHRPFGLGSGGMQRYQLELFAALLMAHLRS